MIKAYMTLLFLLLFIQSDAQFSKAGDSLYYMHDRNIHKMGKSSFKSKIYRLFIRIKGVKKIVEKEFKAGDFSKTNKVAEIPKEVKHQCDISHEYSVNGRAIWTLRKKGVIPQRYILYLHGGSFVHNLTKYDWKLLNRLVQHTGYGIQVPDYPLAPEHGYKDVFDMLVPVYQNLIQQVGNQNVVLMGFSAGGGLGLSLAQHARNRQLAQPSQIILLSPLLDAALQNPEILVLDKHDPCVGIEGLKKAVSVYAKGDDIGNYMISPINGHIEGLAPISLFIGTDEIFLPDAKRLVTLAKAKNVNIGYHVYPGMYHGWFFLNMPEARDVFNKLVDILQ